jgi:hypothetical protein
MSKYSVSVGDDVATFRPSLSSSSVVVNILKTEVDDNGVRRIYLDSLIHGPDDEFSGWTAKGAISTVLTENPKNDMV